MKRILCYGDSNTWGKRAYEGRLPDEKHWTQLLGAKLGPNYKVIQEGLSGRFAGNLESGVNEFKNGQSSFEAIYRSAGPVDIVIIALGTNDLKSKYTRKAKDIYSDIMWYVTKANAIASDEGDLPAKPLIITPANFVPKEDYFFAEPSLREELLELFMECEYPFIMLGDLEITDDGVHYTENDHVRVADSVYSEIKELGL